jgi:HD-GYP domain-containing protein (c-di-GMP phosphodiesterase class II)
MTSDRVCRPNLSMDRAWAELRAHSGTQFDPEIVAAFDRSSTRRAASGPSMT